MLYTDYIAKAKELTITYNEEAMVSYLEPDWQNILYSNNLGDLDCIADMKLDGWYDLEDVLKLEVEKRNAIASKKNVVYDWIYNIISSTMEPAMMEEETGLIQSMIELAKVKKAQQENAE